MVLNNLLPHVLEVTLPIGIPPKKRFSARRIKNVADLGQAAYRRDFFQDYLRSVQCSFRILLDGSAKSNVGIASTVHVISKPKGISRAVFCSIKASEPAHFAPVQITVLKIEPALESQRVPQPARARGTVLKLIAKHAVRALDRAVLDQ